MAVGTDPGLLTHVDQLSSLMVRVRAGEDDALADLVSLSYDHVFPVCRRVIGNDADAAEASREALLEAVRSIREPEAEVGYVTSLYKSAVKAASSHTRRRSRRRAPGSNDVSLIASESDLDSMVESIDLDLALMEVPLELRVAVVLRDLCGLGYPSVADIVDAPLDTAVARVANGRERLVEILGARLAGDIPSPADSHRRPE